MGKPAVNWVAKRSQCNVDTALSALAEIVKRDVSEANRLDDGENPNARRFEIEHAKDHFKVQRLAPPNSFGSPTPFVLFQKSDELIEVYSNNGNPFDRPVLEFKIKSIWDVGAGACRLIADNETQESWQISQRALESLFFD